MENNSLQVGRNGEAAASKYLQNLGYEIIAINWRFRKFEVDIIAQKDQTLVFVEVKTRKNNSHGEPEVFVTLKKQKFLIAAAHQFMTQNSLNLESRFDIIAIISLDQKITHLKGAFVPTIQHH